MKWAFVSAIFILLATLKFEPVESSCCCCCCKPCCCCCCPCCCCCCKPCCCCCCKPCCCCCCCKPCCCCCCPCCCGGRRKRALASAAARGALGNAALVPRVNEPGRQSRSCGQCQCQGCKAASPVTGASPAPAFTALNRQCRQCTPEEERQCLAMMAAQKTAVAPSAAQSTSAGMHLYRKFKRAIALEKPLASGCGAAIGAKASELCKC